MHCYCEFLCNCVKFYASANVAIWLVTHTASYHHCNCTCFTVTNILTFCSAQGM